MSLHRRLVASRRLIQRLSIIDIKRGAISLRQRTHFLPGNEQGIVLDGCRIWEEQQTLRLLEHNGRPALQGARPYRVRARSVSEEQLPPDLPVGRRRGSWSGGFKRGWRISRNAHGHHRLVTALGVVSLGARPLIHHLVRRRVRLLSLQRCLRLYDLSSVA